MGHGKAEQKNILTAPILEQGDGKLAQEGLQDREGDCPSRNSQGSSEASPLIPAHGHCEGLGHQHPAGSGHTAAGDRRGMS